MQKRLIDISALKRFERPSNKLPVEKSPNCRLDIRNTNSDTVEIYLYGDIAWYEITADAVAAMLSGIKAKTIQVRLNSGGGDVFDGVAIYNLLARRPEKVEVYVDALAASIASVIAMAGDEIIIAENALMMIHRAWSGLIGTADDMRSMSEILILIEESQIIPVYQDRTGLSAPDLRGMMKEETWMNAGDAVAKKFATSVGKLSNAKASIKSNNYSNVPAQLKSAVYDSRLSELRAHTRNLTLQVELDEAPISDSERAVKHTRELRKAL